MQFSLGTCPAQSANAQAPHSMAFGGGGTLVAESSFFVGRDVSGGGRCLAM
jgi:hypothetical protein